MTTRDRVLRAATRLFDAGGLDQLSIRAVASRVGVTPMAIYRHFENKATLVDALVIDALAQWVARVRAVEADDAVAWLDLLNEAFLAFALEEPRRFEAAFLLSSRTARRFPDDFAAGHSPAAQIILPRIEQAMVDCGVKNRSALEVWLTIWALTQGLIALYRAGRFAGGEAAFRALYRRTTQRFIRTFLTNEKPDRCPMRPS